MTGMTSNRDSAPDVFVFTKKTAYMQRISDLVRPGHSWYVQGRISFDKARTLVKKFEERYAISRTKLEASRARRVGLSSTRLLLLHQEGQTELDWILLHHRGDEPDADEKWRDAISDRINVTGYELVRLTKPAEPRPVWTWRYTRIRYDDLRNEFIECIRQRRQRDLEQLIHVTWRSPGFHGVREQVKKLRELIKAEWKRSRGSKEELPAIPERIGYLRRLPDVGLKLSTLRRKILIEQNGHIQGSAAPGKSLDTKPRARPEDAVNFFDFIGGDTVVKDLDARTVDLLEEIVARRLRELAADAGKQARAREWLLGFLDWPQPRYKCSRPADVIQDKRALADVIEDLSGLSIECF
jgi:hypothetical protein